MKVILVFVSTLDGKITRWGLPDIRSWSSAEDQSYFSNIMKTSKLVVMGSNTYNTDQALPEAGRLVVVMTSKPENYKRKEVPHQVEFTSRSPQQLVERYSLEGYEEMMVVGGTQVATSFLKEGLIDEIWLTLEPKIFGTGGSFAMAENLDISLKLLNINQVNEQGTFILKYEVVKTKNF